MSLEERIMWEPGDVEIIMLPEDEAQEEEIETDSEVREAILPSVY